MSTLQSINDFITAIAQSLDEQTFVKVSLANYQGDEPNLKQVIIKRVIIRKEAMLSLTYRHTTRDTVKNFSHKVALQMIRTFLHDGFKAATLLTTAFDLQYQTITEGKAILRKRNASIEDAPNTEHDRKKIRHLPTEQKKYLHDLSITSKDGTVYKDAQDKYKQINHYIELLRVMLENLPKHETLHVLDMGSGKGYLTFALYDYLTTNLGINTIVSGVEYREDLVALCTKIALNNSFDKLHFIQGTIHDYVVSACNVLIALHACDTATDDAIIKGILSDADLIVVAPCCHKQIRSEMEKTSTPTLLNSVIRHGIYLERQAEMVTDSLRALLLEQHGYKVKVFDFIATAHTPKNIMIAAEKIKGVKRVLNESENKIKELKAMFGIQTFYLEDKLKEQSTIS